MIEANVATTSSFSEAMIQTPLEGARNTDLEAAFSRHSKALYKIALRKLGNPADAEDALQDGLVSAIENIHQFKGNSQISTWLTAIVINAARLRLRRQLNRKQVSLDATRDLSGLAWSDTLADAQPNPEEAFGEAQAKRILEKVVEELSPSVRTAFRLRVLEGLSSIEAAKALGIREGTLKSRFFRARREIGPRMRQSLKRPR
jgi:RNA polymerase sigma-70 factor (ECF subfamily)